MHQHLVLLLRRPRQPPATSGYDSGGQDSSKRACGVQSEVFHPKMWRYCSCLPPVFGKRKKEEELVDVLVTCDQAPRQRCKWTAGPHHVAHDQPMMMKTQGKVQVPQEQREEKEQVLQLRLAKWRAKFAKWRAKLGKWMEEIKFLLVPIPPLPDLHYDSTSSEDDGHSSLSSTSSSEDEFALIL